MRYQFYREHKYVSSALNDLERLMAKTNFLEFQELTSIDRSFQSLKRLLEGHAQYENERLHTLLKKKHSNIQIQAEEDHIHQEERLVEIQTLIHKIYESCRDDEKISAGHELYLIYRKFVADNLIHLHEEETKILPELQRLYTDEELREVEAKTYHEMSSDDIISMLRELFPHMNPSDRFAFLTDIYKLQPDKFAITWDGIAQTLSSTERENFSREFFNA